MAIRKREGRVIKMGSKRHPRSDRMKKKAFRGTQQNLAAMLKDGAVVLPLAQ
jgi:hypothetical protein